MRYLQSEEEKGMSRTRILDCNYCRARLGELRFVVHDADPNRPSGDYCGRQCYLRDLEGRPVVDTKELFEDLETRWLLTP